MSVHGIYTIIDIFNVNLWWFYNTAFRMSQFLHTIVPIMKIEFLSNVAKITNNTVNVQSSTKWNRRLWNVTFLCKPVHALHVTFCLKGNKTIINQIICITCLIYNNIPVMPPFISMRKLICERRWAVCASCDHEWLINGQLASSIGTIITSLVQRMLLRQHRYLDISFT